MEAHVGPGGTTGPPDRAARDRLTFLTTLLVVVFVVPLAALVTPNTVSYVVPLALPDLGGGNQAGALVRIAGVTLPALMLGAPIAAALVRRISATTVLLASLLVLVAGEGLVAIADSVAMVGVARAAEGFGAGAALPATIAMVWQRRRHRLLAAVWAGGFVAGLLLTMPLAMVAVPGFLTQDWRPALQPHPWFVGLAVAVAALHACCELPGRRRRAASLAAGSDAASPVAMRHDERVQLLLPLVPACGFAFLAIATTYGWSPGARLIVAALCGAGLLGVAAVGSRESALGSSFGYPVVVLTVGMIALPMMAPISGLISAVAGPGGVPLLPFVAGGALAVAGALVMAGAGRPAARIGVLGGHAMTIVAVLLCLTIKADSDQWVLLAPVALLGLGLAVALAAALSNTTVGSALFGISLCFPAVLTGHLVVGTLQLAKLNEALAAGGGTGVVPALTTAFRTWLMGAGALVMVLAVVATVVGRQRRSRKRPVAIHDTSGAEVAAEDFPARTNSAPGKRSDQA